MQFSAGECQSFAPHFNTTTRAELRHDRLGASLDCLNLFNPEAIVKACEVLQHGCSVHICGACSALRYCMSVAGLTWSLE